VQRGVRGTLTPDVEQAWSFQRTVADTVRASDIDYIDRVGVKRFERRVRFLDARQRGSAAHICAIGFRALRRTTLRLPTIPLTATCGCASIGA